MESTKASACLPCTGVSVGGACVILKAELIAEVRPAPLATSV